MCSTPQNWEVVNGFILRTHQSILGRCLLPVMTLAYLTGCEKSSLHTELPSAHYCLDPGDFKAFRPGRLKTDILKDVQWRGDLEEATEYKGKSVSAIIYGLLGGPYSHGDVVWAVFVDDKFEKFVQWPKREVEVVVDKNGERHSHVKPIKIGDFRHLIRAVESEPINITDFEKELERTANSTPSHIPRLNSRIPFARTRPICKFG